MANTFGTTPAVLLTTNDRVPPGTAAAHPDAAQLRRRLRRTTKGQPKAKPEGQPEGQHAVAALLTGRDRQILERLAQLRVLSYAQVHEHFFASASIEATGQRMRSLARRGWVTLWKESVARGGRPNYVLPTSRGLRVGLDAALARVDDGATRRLVRAMLPAGRRRPLVLEPGVRPPFLAHQREINTLALRAVAAFGTAARWISSWDRPFRTTIDGLPLPQPDFVLVINRAGKLCLVFFEHDRGHESLAHFRAAKIERYAELAARPDLIERLTGFRSFVVGVTVLDARFRRPLHRLRTLARATVELGADHLFRYSLAGWVASSLAEARWFAPNEPPQSRSLAIAYHEASLFVPLVDCGSSKRGPDTVWHT